MKGTFMNMLFFSICSSSSESERKRGEKSQLEAWKTVTLHSECRNILTTKWHKRGESQEGGKTKKEGERRRRFEKQKSKRGGLSYGKKQGDFYRWKRRGEERYEVWLSLYVTVPHITHAEPKRTIILLQTHRQKGEKNSIHSIHAASDKTINREILQSTLFNNHNVLHIHTQHTQLTLWLRWYGSRGN